MANEITSSLSFSARKNGASVSFDGSMSVTMTGNELISRTQVIGTTSETIGLGEIAGAPRRIVIKNLDATNFLTIGGDTGLTVFAIIIPPGHFATFQPNTATIYAKADTSAVRIQVVAVES